MGLETAQTARPDVGVVHGRPGVHDFQDFARFKRWHDAPPLATSRQPHAETGFEDLRIQDLCHAAAAWLVQDDVPLRTVRELLRHRNIATTMCYAHASAGW